MNGDQPGGGDHTDARQGQQRMGANEGLDPGREPLRLRLEPSESRQAAEGELSVDAPQAPQATGNCAAMARGDEVLCDALVAGHEHDQIGMKPIAHAGRLGDVVLPGLDE